MFLILSSCSSIASPQTNIESTDQTIKARITYYCAEEPFGSHVAQANVKKATPNHTVAAHPNFKFGTHIIIPKLGHEYIVEDRGPAVTRKTAAGGKKDSKYVFDIFCKNRAEMKKLARTMPEYMEIIVKRSETNNKKQNEQK